MEHHSIEQLRRVADLRSSPPLATTRRERLEQWAHALEREPDVRLHLFHELEFTPREQWAAMRVDKSPLTIAFDDPLLRASGLASDHLGDAIGFFELSDRQTHRLLCTCMHGFSMSAGQAARIVRSMASPLPHILARVAASGVAVAAMGALFIFA